MANRRPNQFHQNGGTQSSMNGNLNHIRQDSLTNGGDVEIFEIQPPKTGVLSPSADEISSSLMRLDD
jgi:hypothetical protein